MKRHENPHTQPFVTHAVFNNWDVVAKGWYAALSSESLPKGARKSTLVCGQKVVFFRGDDGKVRALDAYCPHMGTDLGIGKVVGNEIRCHFHHWRFDEGGQCTHIPCGEPIPQGAKLNAYPVTERYGMIWVFPDAEADAPLVDVPELEGHDVTHSLGTAFTRACHHHVNMVNGIDPQHLKTVHNIDIEMNLDLDEQIARRQIDFVLRGKLAPSSMFSRAVAFILGGEYAYGMRYAHGNIGVLTLMKDVKLFGKFRAPELHMIYAYRIVAPGKSEVQPIYVTRRRRGMVGALVSHAIMNMTRIAYFFLREEDGEIYDNLRMNPRNLLKMDGPLAKYIAWVNRLEPSSWSKAAPLRPGALRVVDDDVAQTFPPQTVRM